MAQVPLSTRFIGIADGVAIPENKTNLLNNKTEPYTIQDLVETIGVGSEGPQGVQGPAGPPGPVGPAGLNWQGAWVSGDSYVEDDAVGYDGASWFCINATSGTTAPDLDTANWALLASQGAIGPQGVQGPQGAQGPVGPSGSSVTGVIKTTITSAQVLQLYSTPITILNNLDFPGKFVYPLSIYIKRNVGDAYTLSTNSLSIINDFNTAIQSGAGINANPLQNAIDGYILQNIPVTQAISGAYQNTTYKLKANGIANPTGGTGDLEVYLTYVAVTL
jgi:hypothetical protein